MKPYQSVLAFALSVTAVSGATLWALASATESDIRGHRVAVVNAGARAAPSTPGTPSLAALPAPVQRYFKFVFPGAVPRATHVDIEMQGRFRRPKTQSFTPTTAEQTIAVGTPAMVFSATTPIVLGVWARAYDAYVDGRMDMKAKVLSAVAVVNESSSPELNRISLRRWLLESPLYPMAMLPGGPVRWEAIDEQRARAVVTYNGLSASLVARFAPDGRLLRFDAEEDGDLTTSYHGSGEHVARDDYQLVDGVRVPMKFVIARAAGGKLYPFWDGRVMSIRFSNAAGRDTKSVRNEWAAP